MHRRDSAGRAPLCPASTLTGDSGASPGASRPCYADGPGARRTGPVGGPTVLRQSDEKGFLVELTGLHQAR